MYRHMALYLLLLLPVVAPVISGEADVVEVTVTKTGENTYDFRVALLHEDIGWEHYANKWEVTDGEGTILGTRILHHPHVNEQPFTRSLSNVRVPEHLNKVYIRAHDSVHGYGGKVIPVELR